MVPILLMVSSILNACLTNDHSLAEARSKDLQ